MIKKIILNDVALSILYTLRFVGKKIYVDRVEAYNLSWFMAP